MNNQTIAGALRGYGFEPSNVDCDRIRKYISILLRWNERVSLTTVAEPIEILKFHFGESFFAIPAAQLREGRLADVGSGAGFPGLALALALPALSVSLIESSGKKSAFLSEVAREVGLDRVRVLRDRMEDVNLGAPAADYITSRALGCHDKLLDWASGSLKPGGKIVLWLGEAEASRISTCSGFQWQPAALIPGSKRRFILVGSRQ